MQTTKSTIFSNLNSLQPYHLIECEAVRVAQKNNVSLESACDQWINALTRKDIPKPKKSSLGAMERSFKKTWNKSLDRIESGKAIPKQKTNLLSPVQLEAIEILGNQITNKYYQGRKAGVIEGKVKALLTQFVLQEPDGDGFKHLPWQMRESLVGRNHAKAITTWLEQEGVIFPPERQIALYTPITDLEEKLDGQCYRWRVPLDPRCAGDWSHEAVVVPGFTKVLVSGWFTKTVEKESLFKRDGVLFFQIQGRKSKLIELGRLENIKLMGISSFDITDLNHWQKKHQTSKQVASAQAGYAKSIDSLIRHEHGQVYSPGGEEFEQFEQKECVGFGILHKEGDCGVKNPHSQDWKGDGLGETIPKGTRHSETGGGQVGQTLKWWKEVPVVSQPGQAVMERKRYLVEKYGVG